MKGAFKITPVQPPSTFVDCLCFQKESKGLNKKKIPLLQSPKTILVQTQRGEIYVLISGPNCHIIGSVHPDTGKQTELL